MSPRPAARPLQPLADWDDDQSAPSGVLWWSRLDERYLVEARALPARRVLLVAFDHRQANEVVGRAVMALVGHPRFGPDPDDVCAWQRAAEGWVDSPGRSDLRLGSDCGLGGLRRIEQ